MVFKIVTGVMDNMISYNFIGSHSVTSRNRYKLTQKHDTTQRPYIVYFC